MDVFEGRALPPGWLVYKTDDGRPYFHSKVTNVTQWAEPTAAVPDAFGGAEETGDIAGARTVTFGKRTGGYATISDATSLPSGPIDVEAGRRADNRPANHLFLGLIDLSPLQCLFDVDTATVKARLLAAMLPYRVLSDAARVARNPDLANEVALDAVTSSIREAPDFYGPLWVSTTLMLALFFGSNAAIYLANSPKSNFGAMVVAFFSVYGYLLGVPALAKGAAMFFGGSAERESVLFRPLISVYGYSFALGIPLTVLCTVPSVVVRFITAGVGAIATLLFLLFNYKTELLEGSANFRIALVVLFAAAQVSFYAAFPLYYFNV